MTQPVNGGSGEIIYLLENTFSTEPTTPQNLYNQKKHHYTMAKISITNHAVERYKERTTEDSIRKDRTDKKIREMIKASIIASDRWPQFEELMKCGQKKEYEFKVRIFDDWDYVATHKVVMVPSYKGRSYTVTTYI